MSINKTVRIRHMVILLLIGLLPGATDISPIHAQEEPTVRAVMFWMEGCGHCDWVKTNVLPPLAAQYGDQWQLELVELRSAEEFDHLFALGEAIGIPRQSIGVPFLLIGDAVLIGSGQIPAELPGLIEQHLAAGGVGWPQTPGLAWFLPGLSEAVPVETVVTPPTPEATWATESAPAPAYSGFTLAVIILGSMVLAVGYTAVRLWRARQSKTESHLRNWVQGALPLLAIIGLGVSAYLAYVETQAVTAICGPVGDCNAVQTSEYAYVLGMPIGVLGVVGYVAILAVWAWGKWLGQKRAALALLALTALGVLFSIYLTYLEPFVIGAVCAWCLTSAVVMTLLLLVSVEMAAPTMQLEVSKKQ